MQLKSRRLNQRTSLCTVVTTCAQEDELEIQTWVCTGPRDIHRHQCSFSEIVARDCNIFVEHLQLHWHITLGQLHRSPVKKCRYPCRSVGFVSLQSRSKYLELIQNLRSDCGMPPGTRAPQRSLFIADISS